jgi:hypothetical protein
MLMMLQFSGCGHPDKIRDNWQCFINCNGLHALAIQHVKQPINKYNINLASAVYPGQGSRNVVQVETYAKMTSVKVYKLRSFFVSKPKRVFCVQ